MNEVVVLPTDDVNALLEEDDCEEVEEKSQDDFIYKTYKVVYQGNPYLGFTRKAKNDSFEERPPATRKLYPAKAVSKVVWVKA